MHADNQHLTMLNVFLLTLMMVLVVTVSSDDTIVIPQDEIPFVADPELFLDNENNTNTTNVYLGRTAFLTNATQTHHELPNNGILASRPALRYDYLLFAFISSLEYCRSYLPPTFQPDVPYAIGGTSSTLSQCWEDFVQGAVGVVLYPEDEDGVLVVPSLNNSPDFAGTNWTFMAFMLEEFGNNGEADTWIAVEVDGNMSSSTETKPSTTITPPSAGLTTYYPGHRTTRSRSYSRTVIFGIMCLATVAMMSIYCRARLHQTVMQQNMENAQHFFLAALAARIDEESNNDEILNLIPLLPVRKLESKDTLPEGHCTVCLEEWEEGDEVKALPCMHDFHSVCIDPWLANTGKCPLCQREILNWEEQPPDSQFGRDRMDSSPTAEPLVDISPLPDTASNGVTTATTIPTSIATTCFEIDEDASFMETSSIGNIRQPPMVDHVLANEIEHTGPVDTVSSNNTEGIISLNDYSR